MSDPELPEDAEQSITGAPGEDDDYEAPAEDDAEAEPAEPEKTWVAFQVIDAAGKHVVGEKCKVKVGDDVTEKNTADEGVVRLDDIDSGTDVEIRLKERYDYEWSVLEVANDPKAEE